MPVLVLALSAKLRGKVINLARRCEYSPHCLVGFDRPHLEAVVSEEEEVIFSTVPLGHVASMDTSTGLSVDWACVCQRGLKKWGATKLLTQQRQNP